MSFLLPNVYRNNFEQSESGLSLGPQKFIIFCQIRCLLSLISSLQLCTLDSAYFLIISPLLMLQVSVALH